MVARGADVIALGAKGDGRADETEVIQRAVDAGGGVHFPTGTFRLTRTVRIDLDRTGFVSLGGDGTARIVMAGPGPAFEFIGTHGGTAAPVTVTPNVWERQRTPRIDNLEIVGAHPEADGIAATGTMQLTITGVVVREARHAIRLHQRNRNVLISDCHLYHNRGIGVFLDEVNLHQINITGSHISYNAGGGVVTRGGVVRNLHIGNCDIEGNMGVGAPPTANVLIDCTGGSTAEVAVTGCTIQHTGDAPGSANIRIIGAGPGPATVRDPSVETNWGHVTITGNVFSDVQVNVHLQRVRGVVLTGNTLWMGFEHDMLVEDSSNVVVGPNILDRNPRYESGGRDARGGVAFLRSRDCTITGLHVSGVRRHAAAVLIDACDRLNISDTTVLDSDGMALHLDHTSLSRVSGCLLRDDRPEPNSAPALRVTGGQGNLVAGNVLDRTPEIAPESGISRDNEIVARSRR